MESSKKGDGKVIIGRVASIFPVIHETNSSHELLESLGVFGKKVHDKCPDKCPVCNHENFSTLELIGVHDKPVFWECEECGSLHCRKDRAWIESRIDKLDDLWTNPNDWDESNKDQLN